MSVLGTVAVVFATLFVVASALLVIALGSIDDLQDELRRVKARSAARILAHPEEFRR